MMDMKEERDSAPQEKTRWREVLYDFTQNTTIHALKQITEPTPFLIRRLIWILILALGLLLFGVQVVDSIIYYLSNPVAVNIMINYNDTLRFPAVTICNQNAFRMTKASRANQYDAIETLFSHNHMDNLNSQSHPEFDEVLDSHISQMYSDLSHLEEDFIVSCQWEQQKCSAADFERTLTDHGVCFTFNSHPNETNVKNASQTGAQWGLRLRLNIEQYEYMMGPNDGAGVRVLVHSQGDYPLVGDFGQSVPPGMHAFLGIMIVEIHDLPAPHGKCQDDVQLESFEHYTQGACIRECKQRMVRIKCNCSHGVLPKDAPPRYPACTLRQQLSCVHGVLNAFPDYREVCSCPYPCDRMHFDSDITYGDMSKFDMEKILFGNMTKLQTQYSNARETAQLTKKEIVRKDRENAALLAENTDNMTIILEEIPADLQRLTDILTKDADIVKRKIWFHNYALEKVTYAAEHDFVRGWEIVEERTFNHVATGFWEIVSSFDRVLEMLTTKYNGAELVERELLWYSMDDRLHNRLTMAERALENLTEVYEAYSTGKTLINFRNTLDRRYDNTLVPVHLVVKNAVDRNTQFLECKQRLVQFISAVRDMRQCGKIVVLGNTTDQCDNLDANRDSFVHSAKMVNYRLFQFRTKVLVKPVEEAQELERTFRAKNDSLWKEYTLLSNLIEVVMKDIRHFVSTSWVNMRQASECFSNYTLGSSITKASLANRLNSVQMDDDLLTFQHFFLNLRSRSREIKDSCLRIKDLYIDIFTTMITEKSTEAFYGMLYNDTTAYFKNPSNASDYVRHFKYFIKDLTKSEIRELPKSALLSKLNADFHGMDVSDKTRSVTDFFDTEILPGAEIDATIRNLDESLNSLLNIIREDLKKFTESTKIEYSFFRENYLNLDVYMRALSYEAIQQQVAYDMTNLWSDIGGSIGLFIGASAISVFEILDIFLHTGMKRAREKHKKQHKGRSTETEPMSKINNENKDNGNFTAYMDSCLCPYNCHRTNFDADITYGGMSESSLEKLLYTTSAGLRTKYTNARETAQISKKAIANEDKRQSALLSRYVSDIEHVLEDIANGLDSMMNTLSKRLDLIKRKSLFHLHNGLQNVKFTIEHDFIRGWEIIEERTFDHVATGFWEIVSSYDRTMALLRTNGTFHDVSHREILWFIMDNRLDNRLTMAQRALTNLSEIATAYKTAKPLLVYSVTLDRRYDMTFLPVSMMKEDIYTKDLHYNNCLSSFSRFIRAIKQMRVCGEEAVIGNFSQCEEISRDRFIASAKTLNKHIFLFKEQVVEKPLKAIHVIITEFIKKKEAMWLEVDILTKLVEATRWETLRLNHSMWYDLQNAAEEFSNYAFRRSMTKSTLATIMNSHKMDDVIVGLRNVFRQFYARLQAIKDSCDRLRVYYLNLYEYMRNEGTTKPFYTALNRDVMAYISQRFQNNSRYISHFASLLKMSKSRVTSLSIVSLVERLNADFSIEINTSDSSIHNISNVFDRQLRMLANSAASLQYLEILLMDCLDDSRLSLSQFLASTDIGHQFYRDNFISVDVYFRELKTEQISQRVAYDMTSLWSDIGGLLGLMIGAGAISIVEVLDIFIHTFMKRARERRSIY